MTDASLSERPKRQRASGSETRRRAGMVNFRATEEEREELEAAAARVGLSLGSYIRARTLTAPKTRAQRRPSVERAALGQLLGQIGRIGNNLNQIARSENRGQDAEWVYPALRQALAELTEIRDAIMQALGRGVEDARDEEEAA